mgnify:CR=1 FL=1
MAKEFDELIDLLSWAYVQGYKHASDVVAQTVPQSDKLKEMFTKMMKEKQEKENQKK